jgi:maleylacetate reductase
VYDPALTDSMPTALAVASGLNALAHCVDALWAPRADPVNGAFALEGARRLAVGLRAVVAGAADDGRDEALLGAHLAAVAFASSGSALHHKVCHVLGGTFGLPHAATHAVVLPHVLALNAPAVPGPSARLADALGMPSTPAGGPASAVAALEVLRSDLGAPTALREHGLAEDDLDEATTRCLAVVPASNPVPVTRTVMAALLRSAWAGAGPTPG